VMQAGQFDMGDETGVRLLVGGVTTRGDDRHLGDIAGGVSARIGGRWPPAGMYSSSVTRTLIRVRRAGVRPGR
jgi:hypothetical protein